MLSKSLCTAISLVRGAKKLVSQLRLFAGFTRATSGFCFLTGHCELETG